MSPDQVGWATMESKMNKLILIAVALILIACGNSPLAPESIISSDATLPVSSEVVVVPGSSADVVPGSSLVDSGSSATELSGVAGSSSTTIGGSSSSAGTSVAASSSATILGSSATVAECTTTNDSLNIFLSVGVATHKTDITPLNAGQIDNLCITLLYNRNTSYARLNMVKEQVQSRKKNGGAWTDWEDNGYNVNNMMSTGDHLDTLCRYVSPATPAIGDSVVFRTRVIGKNGQCGSWRSPADTLNYRGVLPALTSPTLTQWNINGGATIQWNLLSPYVVPAGSKVRYEYCPAPNGVVNCVQTVPFVAHAGAISNSDTTHYFGIQTYLADDGKTKSYAVRAIDSANHYSPSAWVVKSATIHMVGYSGMKIRYVGASLCSQPQYSNVDTEGRIVTYGTSNILSVRDSIRAISYSKDSVLADGGQVWKLQGNNSFPTITSTYTTSQYWPKVILKPGVVAVEGNGVLTNLIRGYSSLLNVYRTTACP